MSFALETPPVVSSEDERKMVVDVVSMLAAGTQECSVQADVLTKGDLPGHHSHRLQRLRTSATRISRADAKPMFAWIEDTALSEVCGGLPPEAFQCE
jgi:LDH2 family malate/lactate/ureidoglycolate dehydrogenase